MVVIHNTIAPSTIPAMTPVSNPGIFYLSGYYGTSS